MQRRIAASGFVRRHAWLSILINALDAGILFWATALGVHIALAVSTLPANVVHLLDQTLLILVCVSVTIVAARFTGNAVLRLSRGPGQQIASGSLFATVSQALIYVLGALFTLAAQGHLPWLPVILITIREVGMQLYRSWVGRRGVSIPARRSAKLKTLVQDFAIGTVIIPPLADQHSLQLAMIWFACALTLYTGAEYLLDGRRALHRPVDT